MWQTEMLLKLRGYINDMDDQNQKYTDNQLKRYLLLGLSLMQAEFKFRTGYYAVDIEGDTITPDPTSSDPRDEDCIALTILKAGDIIMRTEVRVYGGQAIAIRDGSSSIDLKRDMKSLIELANGFKTEYETAKLAYIRGDGLYGRAILYCDTYFWEDCWDYAWRFRGC